MSHFDEKSGTVDSKTEFGSWYQTTDEVVIEADFPEGVSAKQTQITLNANFLKCAVRGNTLFEGKPFDTIVQDESTWTIEDKKHLRIQLVKAHPEKDRCWESLLQNQFKVDPFTFNEMRKKLDLEQFQIENPGFDFSNAKLDKKYDEKYLKQYQKEQSN